MTFAFTEKHVPIAAVILIWAMALAQPLAAQDVAAPNLLDLADPAESPIGNFAAKLAYNSNLGTVAGVSYTANQVFGRPHKLVLSAEASASDRRLNFGYIIPSLSDKSP